MRIVFNGKGLTNIPPLPGVPEEPLHIHMTGPKSLMDATTNSVDALINKAAREEPLIAAQNRIWCQWGDESISIAATGIIASISTQ